MSQLSKKKKADHETYDTKSLLYRDKKKGKGSGQK